MLIYDLGRERQLDAIDPVDGSRCVAVVFPYGFVAARSVP